MMPELTYGSPTDGARKAQCWVQVLSQEIALTPLGHALVYKVNTGKLAAFGFVCGDGCCAVVVKMPSLLTKQDVCQKLETVYKENGLGLKPEVEALDGLHVDIFGLHDPERVRKAADAANEDGIYRLRHLPVLGWVDDRLRRLALPDISVEGTQQHSGHNARWHWSGEVLQLEVTHKGRMQDDRRIEWVLHRAAKAGERILPDLSSLPAFYRIFHDIFRLSYGAKNAAVYCEKRGLEVFSHFAQKAGVAVERCKKGLPIELRCAVETVTRGTPVNRCMACAKEIPLDVEYCSEECRGACSCMVCSCGVDVVCKICSKARGRGEKRPTTPAVTKHETTMPPRGPGAAEPCTIATDPMAESRAALRKALEKHEADGTEPVPAGPWLSGDWKEMLRQLKAEPPVEYVPNPRWREPVFEKFVYYECNTCKKFLKRKGAVLPMPPGALPFFMSALSGLAGHT